MDKSSLMKKTSFEKMRLGFIGLGIMGIPMSINLKKKNPDLEMFAYNRSKKNYDELERLGVELTTTASDVVGNADIIFTMVPTGNDVQQLYKEVHSEICTGKIFVDMSTIEPYVSQEMASMVKQSGGQMLDAPVVKSHAAAVDGTLGIYVGGETHIYQKILPFLKCMGSNVIYLGKNGAGLVMKICHNMLVGEIQNGVNEMLTLAQKFGIRPSIFQKAISCGGGSNFYLDTKIKNIEKMHFPTAFSIQNMHKDVHIAQELMQNSGLQLPGVENVVCVYDQAMNSGLGQEDFSASYKVVIKEILRKGEESL